MNMRILVYKDGELDGIAYKETNEYVKAKEHSFFDYLTNIPVNYLIIEKFILFRERITSLDQMKYDSSACGDMYRFVVEHDK